MTLGKMRLTFRGETWQEVEKKKLRKACFIEGHRDLGKSQVEEGRRRTTLQEKGDKMKPHV